MRNFDTMMRRLKQDVSRFFDDHFNYTKLRMYIQLSADNIFYRKKSDFHSYHSNNNYTKTAVQSERIFVYSFWIKHLG